LRISVRMTKGDMQLDKADSPDYSLVARLHSECLPDGFLTQLGIPFLSFLYYNISQYPKGTVIVAREGTEVAGFVTGVGNTRNFYRYFIGNNFFRAAWLIFPALFKKGILFRIWKTVCCPQQGNKPDWPAAELFSLAVHPDYRGRGVAGQLFDGLVAHFRKNGINEFKIVAGAELARAQRFYEHKGCQRAGMIEVHGGSRSIVYTFNIS